MPPGLTLRNSSLCPKSIFYVALSYYNKQRLFSIYTINRLILITESVCVYGAVRSESLNVIQVYFGVWMVWKRDMKVDVSG